MVFHDTELERVCGVEGDLKDYTYEQLKEFTLFGSEEKIPTLKEAMDLIDGKVPVIVEYKGESLDVTVAKVTDQVLCEYDGVYCIQSFNPMIVGWYRVNRKEVIRGQLSEKLYSAPDAEKSALNFVLENLLLNVYAKPDFIAYKHDHYDNLSRRLVNGLFGKLSLAYTITNQEEYEAAKEHFDMIIFDSFIPE
jgi:glycerophosphoryl diester phosphodiesterase